MKKNKNIRLFVFGVSLFDGMAGTKRVGNMIKYLQINSDIKIYNISENLFQLNDRKRTGSYNNINYAELSGKTNCPIINQLLYFVLGIYFILRYKNKKFKNIIYNYGYPNLKNFFHLTLARLSGYKIIFDIVEDNSLASNFKSKLSRLKNFSSIQFLKKIHFLTTDCIVISTHLEKKIKSLHSDRIRIHYIPIGIDLKKIKINSYQQKKK